MTGDWMELACYPLGEEHFSADRNPRLAKDEEILGTMPFFMTTFTTAQFKRLLVELKGDVTLTDRRLICRYNRLPAYRLNGPLKGDIVSHERLSRRERRVAEMEAKVQMAAHILPYSEIGRITVSDQGTFVAIEPDPQIFGGIRFCPGSIMFHLFNGTEALAEWFALIAPFIARCRSQGLPTAVNLSPSERGVRKDKVPKSSKSWTYANYDPT